MGRCTGRSDTPVPEVARYGQHVYMLPRIVPPRARQTRATSLGTIMQSILILIVTILQLYMWVIIVNAIMSWLIAFNVVNTQNRLVGTVMDLTYRLTEPVLGPIRRFLPNLGGIDISPIVLILGIIFVQNLLYEYFGPGAAYGGGY